MILWLAYMLWTRDPRMKHLPPGPKGLPVIGNMLEMADTDKMMTLSKQWADEYGDVFYTKVGLQHFVWLSSASAVKDLMDKRGSIYSPRAASPMINMVSNQERLNFLPYGEKWRTIRNILSSIQHSIWKHLQHINPFKILSQNRLFGRFSMPKTMQSLATSTADTRQAPS